MSLYCLELTPNSSNIFLLALERVCSFIVKAESSISGHLKSLTKNYFFVFFFDASTKMATIGEMSNFQNFFKGPEMELSEVMMKTQTCFRDKRNILELFVVNFE